MRTTILMSTLLIAHSLGNFEQVPVSIIWLYGIVFLIGMFLDIWEFIKRVEKNK